MNIKEALKISSNKHKLVYYSLAPLTVLYNWIRFRLIPEKQYILHMFESKMGYKLDLEKPKTLNEKIQWLKLYDRTHLHTLCADKYLVRNFINEKIGSQYLIPLLYSTDDARGITIGNMPSYPFIIKTNHDSGTYYIIKDKDKIDWGLIRNNLKKALKKNYYYSSKEWQYKNITARIVVEKLLMKSNGDIPYDYKVHCINGKVEMISVDMDRGSLEHKRNWYDKEWERLPFKWSSVLNGCKTDPSIYEVSKPKILDEMIRCSEALAHFFYYVRVDWYDVDGELFFGELTFHHDSGFRPIEPREWDLKLGEILNLPIDG